MADIELNKLGLKSDSLPNDWLITLVNPKTGEAAENMTIARFKELLPYLLKSGDKLTGPVYLDSLERVLLVGNITPIQFINVNQGQHFNSMAWTDYEKKTRLFSIGTLTRANNSVYTANEFHIGWGDTPWEWVDSLTVTKDGVWFKGQSLLTSTNSVTANALTETIIEEVPVSANTPMTLEETGQPNPVTQTIEKYEYSIPKMAEAILELQKQVHDLKA